MKSWTRNQFKRLRIYFILNSDKRNRYLKKNKIFKEMGENVFFQPRMIPSDPLLIKFHNNIVVTSNVIFVTHDVFNLGLKNISSDLDKYYQNAIEVCDNVFRGCNTTILPGVKIGPNALIGAGSVVTQNVLPNTVVAGNPARVIGTFDDFLEKRKRIPGYMDINDIWRDFDIKNRS